MTRRKRRDWPLILIDTSFFVAIFAIGALFYAYIETGGYR